MGKQKPENTLRIPSIIKKVSVPSLLMLILFSAFLIRVPTLWISHWRGDQNIYLGLALKLDKHGLDQYNIRGIDIGMVQLARDKKMVLLSPVLTNKPDSQGTVLKGLIETGAEYYDLPLFQNAPGFPFLLMLSHRIFHKRDAPYFVAYSDSNKSLLDLKLQNVLNAQFYAIIIPLLFSMLTILAVFALGNYLFSSRIGLYSAFIYAIDPVNILSSQKIWADDMLTFFITISVLIFAAAFRKKIALAAIFSGLACGIAALAKQSAMFLAPGIWLFTVLARREELKSIKNAVRVAFNSYFMFFLAGLLISTAFWFYKVYAVYGTPLYWPDIGDVVQKDATGWFRILTKRPHSYILYSVGIPFLCPIFALAYLSLKNLVQNITKALSKKQYDYRFILLWFWILSIFFLFHVGKEHRYMLPIHPSLAILSAYYLNRLKCFIGFKRNNWSAEFVTMAILILTAFRTIPVALDVVMKDGALFLMPF